MQSQTHRAVTVGDIIDRLSSCDRDAQFFLAINPEFPHVHFAGDIVTARDGRDGQVVFLGEAEQGEILPPAIAQALTWHPPTVTASLSRLAARRSAGPA
ncbi:hypothetical protein ACFXA3_33435 [Streptomyces sp. NPDC059456]|uniref:hypothetical protein n=1 Tax=Streptomyces sp. NPDC059456 TaxID=3346838 RepID=UPI0036A64EA8